jgi:hypothetical protein
MKQNFELGLKKSKAERHKVDTSALVVPEDSLRSGRLPWDVAKAMYEKTVAEGPAEVKPSCVSVRCYSPVLREGMVLIRWLHRVDLSTSLCA